MVNDDNISLDDVNIETNISDDNIQDLKSQINDIDHTNVFDITKQLVVSAEKIDNFLGSLSYPIYINHFSICILYYSILQFNQLVINNSIFVCSLFIITLFSIFTILIVERNISKMRSRVRKVKL